MSKTGTMTVIGPEKTITVSWNGIPEERAEARRIFEERMATGSYLASVVDVPGRGTQVRSFDEVENVEKVRGQVEVKISPALRGG